MKISFKKIRVLFAGIARPNQHAKNTDPHRNTENNEFADSPNVKQSNPQQTLNDSDGDP